MTRATPDWFGKSDDTPAPPRVKARIILAQDGICACGCGVKLGASGEAIEFDHTKALINGGENCESNLRALRRPCHKAKTAQDVREKAAVARKRAKNLGIKESRCPLPGSRRSKFKRKIDGTVVPRDD